MRKTALQITEQLGAEAFTAAQESSSTSAETSASHLLWDARGGSGQVHGSARTRHLQTAPRGVFKRGQGETNEVPETSSAAGAAGSRCVNGTGVLGVDRDRRKSSPWFPTAWVTQGGCWHSSEARYAAGKAP